MKGYSPSQEEFIPGDMTTTNLKQVYTEDHINSFLQV